MQKSQIIRVTKASEHLCTFSCMYNSLRRDDLRRAFCCENAKEIASKMFVELAAGQRDFQSDQLLDRVKDGYVRVKRYESLQAILNSTRTIQWKSL